MNSLLSLPTDHLVANLLGILVCATIMVVCVCRVAMMPPTRWRMTLEQVMLLAFALWAAGTVADLARGQNIGGHGAAAGLGILIYLFTSYKQWHLKHALLVEARERGGFPHQEAHVHNGPQGGIRCQGCPGRSTCSHGCVRQMEAIHAHVPRAH